MPPDRQWFHDDDFDTRLPDWLAEDVVRFYGDGVFSVDFAQGLAGYLSARGLRLTADPASDAPEHEGFVPTKPWGPLLKGRARMKNGTWRGRTSA